jgi:hypothetical protein
VACSYGQCNKFFGVIKGGKLPDQPRDCHILKKDFTPQRYSFKFYLRPVLQSGNETEGFLLNNNHARWRGPMHKYHEAGKSEEEQTPSK